MRNAIKMVLAIHSVYAILAPWDEDEKDYFQAEIFFPLKNLIN
jgi:hypothetical protein